VLPSCLEPEFAELLGGLFGEVAGELGEGEGDGVLRGVAWEVGYVLSSSGLGERVVTTI
jgi:hypothetical protein